MRSKPKSYESIYTPFERLILFGTIIVFMVLVLIPFITLVSGSLSDSDAITDYGVRLWPREFTLDAYRIVFMYPGDMLISYGISIFVTIAGTAINVLLCSMVAFALSRSYFRYRKAITVYLMFTVMFNAGFIPQYILYRNYLMLYDTYWVLILSPAVMVGHIIMLRAFYSALPEELYESVRLEGANQFVVFSKIATPLILPGIATVTFYSVLTYWNDPSTAMLYTEDIVPVALYLTRITNYIEFLKYAQENGFSGLDMSNYKIPEATVVYAIALATTAPMLCLFAAFQKYFVRGLTSGSVKG